MADFEEFIRTCEEKHLADRGRIKKLEETTARIFEILDKYKDRPSWIITVVITLLTGALGATVAELLHRISSK